LKKNYKSIVLRADCKIWKKNAKNHEPDLPEERSRIMKAGGEVSEGRVNGMLALSRAIGDFDYKPITPPKDA
jgi:serine/threonine protein phosphatase PrpC